MSKYPNIDRLVDIIAQLRAENGCPWDREQTHETLKRNILEETYELIDAINDNNKNAMKEELGDVLLQVVFHAQIAHENGEFDIDDVAKTISDKLIRRHPHVFGNTKVSGTDEVLKNWDEIKKTEYKNRTSALDGVVQSQPALMSAQQISKKAVKVGFEWPDYATLKECLNSEIEEFEEAREEQNKEHMEEEFGDILFALVNVARWNKIDAEQALIKANSKFKKRFQKMEELALKNMKDHTLDEFDDLWKKAKKELGYKNRSMKETIKDTVKWLKDNNRI